jgi:hypothetical protein
VADEKPAGLSDEEWAAIRSHRADSAPKRKGTLRGTDPDSGAEYEIELTVEETARLAARHLAGLFKSDDAAADPKDPAKPAVLKDYFGRGKKAAGT